MATTGARSIAKDISRREPPQAPEGEDSQAHEEQNSQAHDEQAALEADEQSDPQAAEEQRRKVEADEEPNARAAEQQPNPEVEQSDARADEEQSDFEANMYELQADLGEEWILHFSVQGDDGWLTAERQDGTQRVEAPDAQRLVTIIDAIVECGGRKP
jgi:hypothetical protein